MYDQSQQKALFDRTKALLTSEISVEEIEDVRDLLRYHEWKYYVENNPVISDFEYDQLFKKLQKLETENPQLITVDSPTQRLSQDTITDFTTVAHIIPMLSLDNSYNAEDLLEFDKQVRKLTEIEGDLEYAVEPKFDGGSIALLYENDYLIRAATRGDGIMGEEITANIKTLASVPLKAPFSKYGYRRVELRGEALIPKDRFKNINEAREKEGLVLFANPRNAATGGLRTKNPNETRDRGLEAFIFQFGYAEDNNGNEVSRNLKAHFSSIEMLGQLGFKIPHAEKKLCKNIGEVIDFCRHWEEKRDDYRYEIDGMVVKVNDVRLQEICGSTSHHPRWAIAYKFKAKQATSKLINVEYQVGKIGSITPVAKLNPVQLAGVTVSSVSLHNEDFITSKDLHIGDTVLVERSGDVIPYIVKAMEELRDGSEKPIVFPEFCPVNNTEIPIRLERVEGEAAWRCPNCVCGAQTLQKMIFHVSKEAMDIDGFGKSYVERFYELGWLKDLADIYNLDYDAIAGLEGFGKKSAEKLRSSIEKAKKNPISRLLQSLTIHHLGKKASKIVAEQIGHVLDLKNWKHEDFTSIKDIGPVVAENVYQYFSNEENIRLLEKMESFGVNLTQTDEDKPRAVNAEGALAGKTILFTGTLHTMGRKQAEELAEQHGAKNISAVSKNLDILVVGENAGSKLTKAQSLGSVTIYTEQEFLDLIG
ncbi:MAG: NAD-dependent DNA ligase LigA [Saprospiraceae bacterium]|nr:NAD-dependent DNA ligase LigA [Saprospiraceae bacterium]